MAQRLWQRRGGEVWMVNPRRVGRNPTLAVVGLGNPHGGGTSMAKRHHRRHRRHNPGGSVQLLHPTTWAPLGAGVVGAAAAAYAPKVVFGDGATTVQAYATQVVVAFGGSWLAGRFMSPAARNFFLAGALLPVASDVVRRGLAVAGVSVPGLSRYGGGTIRGGALDGRLGAAYYGGGSRYYLGSSIADEGVVGPGRYQALGRG